jgi:single-stranded-DNA-specific exonuclease
LIELNDRIQNLIRKAEELSKYLKEIIRDEKLIEIFSHIDADGISAAGIIGKTLARENCPFQIRILKQLNLQEIKEISRKKSNSCYIFCDMGSGQLQNLNKYFEKANEIFIFDHHEIIDRESINFPNQLNPHLFDLNGSNEISGAGIVYLISRSLNKNNKDLSSLALVGAVGDIQDKGVQRSFLGVNKEIILKDALDEGIVKEFKDILLFGSETRPLHLSLKYTTDPYIPGLSGEEEKCLSFLKEIEIELTKDSKWRTLSDLDKDEKIKLYSSLVTYMLQKGVESESAQELIGHKYIILNEESGTFLRDIREYASILNACGRNDYPGLGISICLGDREKSLEEAQEVLNKYRQKISSYLSWLNEPDRIKEMQYIRVIHGEDVIDEKMIGTIASILSRSNTFGKDKALICFAYASDGNKIKVSARGSQILIEKGLDLAKALRLVLDKMDFEDYEAGGHDIAAGAEIEVGSEDTFAAYLNKILEDQLRV